MKYLLLLSVAACSSSSPPSDGGGSSDSSSDSSSVADAAMDVVKDTAAVCKHAGDMCSPNEICNLWNCNCVNTSTPFMTVGACKNGTCQAGTDACANICANAGGVKTAMDNGC